MRNHQNLDAFLRSMDAAEQSSAHDPQRSDKDLEQIIRSHPNAEVHKSKLVDYRKSTSLLSRHRRVFALGTLALASTAGLIVVPAIAGGDPAFATWTAAPGELIGAERDSAVSDCIRSKQGVGGGMYSNDLATAEVAIAEKRGAWTTIVLSGTDGFEATCTTDTTAPWFKRGSFGSIGRPGNGAALTARAVSATQLGTGVIADGPLSMASGQASPDVTAITYIRANGERVEATVSKGQFAFWFPGSELSNSSDQAVPIEVTYDDGTTGTQYLSL